MFGHGNLRRNRSRKPVARSSGAVFIVKQLKHTIDNNKKNITRRWIRCTHPWDKSIAYIIKYETHIGKQLQTWNEPLPTPPPPANTRKMALFLSFLFCCLHIHFNNVLPSIIYATDWHQTRIAQNWTTAWVHGWKEEITFECDLIQRWQYSTTTNEVMNNEMEQKPASVCLVRMLQSIAYLNIFNNHTCNDIYVLYTLELLPSPKYSLNVCSPAITLFVSKYMRDSFFSLVRSLSLNAIFHFFCANAIH